MTIWNRALSSPTITYPFVAIIVVVLVFLGFYLPLKLDQEEILNDRAFRTLAGAGDRLTDTVNSYSRALQALNRISPTANLASKEYASYVANQVPTLRYEGNCTLTPLPPEADLSGVRVDYARKPHNLQFWQRLGKGIHCATAPINDLLIPLISPDELFDEILLTDQMGRVVYQTVRTGIRVENITSLPVTQLASGGFLGNAAPAEAGNTQEAAPLGLNFRAAGLYLVDIGGEEFRLYGIPFGLPTGSEQAAFTIMGLMKSQRFRAETMSVPGNWLLRGIVAILLIIFVSWPLLKFWMMRPTERISTREAVYTVIFTVLIVSLLILLAIPMVNQYKLDGPGTDSKLEWLAEQIDSNVADEVERVLRTLDAVEESPAMQDLRPENRDFPCGTSPDKWTIRDSRVDVLLEPGLPLDSYPYFDNLFWTDDQGFQQVKWTARKSSTPPTRLCGYNFYEQTMAGQLWSLPSTSDTPRRFRIDPLYSPNTGSYRAVISRPALSQTDPKIRVASISTELMSLISPVLPPQFGFAVVAEDGSVLFHSTEAKNGRENFFDEAENDPALRAAVRNHRWSHLNVSYLGSDHRFLVSSFRKIKGCPWALIVFRKLDGQEAQTLDAILLTACLIGTYCLLFIVILLLLPATPLCESWVWPQQKLRPSYRVLSGSLLLVAAAFYRLITTADPTTVLLSTMLVPAASFFFFIRKLRSPNLESSRFECDPCIFWAAVIGGVVTTVGTLFFTARIDARALSTAMLWGAIWLGFVLLSLRPRAPRPAGRRPRRLARYARTLDGFLSRASLPAQYALTLACLLTVLTTLPSLAFFKIAYDHQMRLFVIAQQLEVKQELRNRELRVKALYQGVRFDTNSAMTGKETARWLFLHRRLGSETLDRYDRAFLGLRSGQLFFPGASDSRDASAVPTFGERAIVRMASWVSRMPNDAAAPTREVNRHLHGSPIRDQEPWVDHRVGANHLRVVFNSGAPGGALTDGYEALVQFASNDWTFSPNELLAEVPRLTGFWWLLVFVIVLGLSMFLWFWFIVLRLFSMDLQVVKPWERKQLQDAVAMQRNLILLRTPGSESTAVPAGLADVFPVDMAKAELQAEPSLPSTIAETTVVLDRFDYRFGNQEVVGRKLAMLEKLVFVHGKKVIIVSSVDPLFYLISEAKLRRPADQAITSLEDMDRWAKILTGFETFRLNEALSPEMSSQYHRSLWESCTTLEQAQLAQLAQEGCLNSKNEDAVRHLTRRGLLEVKPVPRFVDQGFLQFVRESVHRGDRIRWERQDRRTSWDGLRIVFFVLIFGMGLFLAFTQRTLFGYILSALGALAPLNRLLSEFRGQPSAPGPEEIV